MKLKPQSEKCRAQAADVERRSVAELIPFPLQNHVLLDIADNEIEALAASIAVNGQLIPIEILPNGKIIDGHQRWRACLHLKLKEIDCKVRYDLEDDEIAQERVFIELNANRRQLSPLGKARCLKELMRIEEDSIRMGKSERLPGVSLRDQVARSLNMSGRNAERWIRVLNLPLPLQQAVEEGRLKLDLAARLAVRDEDEWQIVIAIAERGDDCNKSVAALLGQNKSSFIKLYEFRQAIERLTNMLPKELEKINFGCNVAPAAVNDAVNAIHGAATMLVELTKCASLPKSSPSQVNE